MTTLTKTALAALLLAGAGATVAAPAAAKKKEEAPASSGLKLSPDVLKVAQPAQTALAAKDIATAEPLVMQAEAAAKTEDDHYIAAALRLNVEQLKLQGAAKPDYTPLKAPLEVLVGNAKTPKDQAADFAYKRGQIAAEQRNYADAVTWFGKAKAMGATNPELGLQMVSAKISSGDVQGGSADMEAVIAAQSANGQKAPEDLYRFAISKTLNAKLYPQTVSWMQRYLAAYPTAKNWRDMLYIYALQQGSVIKPDKPQTVDLFRLMRQTKGLDQYGYEEYGQKVVDSGLPDEAKTLIAEGKASGKIPATDANASDIVAQANKMIAAEGSLPALENKAKASGNGLLSAQTGDAYLGKGDYAKAIALYQQALTKGGVKTDEVNTHLGIAKAMSGDKAGAKAAFAAVTTAPRNDIAGFWSVYVDTPAITA